MGMHPRVRAAIERYIAAGSLPIRGANPVSGARSNARLLPGTHAEILTTNRLLLKGASSVEVASVHARGERSGEHIVACMHCTGILGNLPEVRIFTGTSVPHHLTAARKFSEARQLSVLLDPTPGRVGSSHREARALVRARSMPGGLIRGDVLRVPGSSVFRDASGPLGVFLPPHGTRPLDLDRTAHEVLAMARRTATTPPTNQPSGLRVILDDLNLPPSEAQALRDRVRALASRSSDRDVLSRIMSLDTATTLDR